MPGFKLVIPVLEVIFLLLCLILGVVFAIRERENNMRLWQAQRFDAMLILTSSCDGNGDSVHVADKYKRCADWAKQLINADVSQTENILRCMDLQNLVDNPPADATAANAQLQACVAALGITKPNFQ